jgi:hypothetical protein
MVFVRRVGAGSGPTVGRHCGGRVGACGIPSRRCNATRTFFAGGDRRWMRIPSPGWTKCCGGKALRVSRRRAEEAPPATESSRCRRSVRDRTRSASRIRKGAARRSVRRRGSASPSRLCGSGSAP